MLVALTLVTFWPHLRHGGFYSDDWSIAADAHFEKPTYFGAVRKTFQATGGRPVLAALYPVPHLLFGQSAAPQIALGLALGIATCLSFFVLLRMLGLRTLPATLIACLALVFPWADSIRLWPTASMSTVAVALCFLGVSLALAALARQGRGSIFLHAASVTCYAASILAYQAAGVALLLVIVIYLVHAEPKRALRRWSVDVTVVLAALAWSANRTRHVRHVASPHQMLVDIPTFVRQGVVLFADALLAFPGADRPALKGFVLIVVIAGVVAAVVRARRHPAADRRWLFVAAASIALLVAADAILLGSFLHPLDHGIDNRLNLLAAFAYAPLVYACVMLLANLIRRPIANAIGVVCVCLIAFGWVLRVRSDEGDWVRAALQQKSTLASLDRELPVIPAHSSLVVVSFPGQTAPQVPVFEETWDLAGALELTRRDRTLAAFPVFDDGSLTCGAGELIAQAPGSFGRQEISYRELYLVSPDRHARVAGRSDCQRELPAFPLGPRTSSGAGR